MFLIHNSFKAKYNGKKGTGQFPRFREVKGKVTQEVAVLPLIKLDGTVRKHFLKF